jgi:hypothetical protein
VPHSLTALGGKLAEGLEGSFLRGRLAWEQIPKRGMHAFLGINQLRESLHHGHALGRDTKNLAILKPSSSPIFGVS